MRAMFARGAALAPQPVWAVIRPPEARPGHGVRPLSGTANLGLTCYANACLAMLGSHPGFRAALLLAATEAASLALAVLGEGAGSLAPSSSADPAGMRGRPPAGDRHAAARKRAVCHLRGQAQGGAARPGGPVAVGASPGGARGVGGRLAGADPRRAAV